MVRTRNGKRSFSGIFKTSGSLESLDEGAGAASALPTQPDDGMLVFDKEPSTSGKLHFKNTLDLPTLTPTLQKSICMPEEMESVLEESEEEFLSDASREAEDSEGSIGFESETDDIAVGMETSIIQLPTNRTWTPHRKIQARIPFTETTGLTIKLEGGEPIDMFKATLGENIIDLTVTETNKFGAKLKDETKLPKSRMKKWNPLTVEEFLTWLGLLYHMGTIPLPRLKDYWNTNPLFSIPIFRSCMSRDRFCCILQSLHFTEKLTTPADRLTKIRPLLDAIHTTMDSIYKPSKQLCIDESMVLWRDRLISRVYLKGKRHISGIKLYMLTEPSGLVLCVIVYAGASDPIVGGKGHAEKVVHKLMEGRLDRGYSLFMDNYYNSVSLVHELLERKTYATGTLRENRKGNPTTVSMVKLKPNDITATYSDKSVCVLKWRDRRDVLMISSEFGANMIELTNRRGLLRSKPEVVVKYNEAMVGIDRADQMMAYYPIERKSVKWYKKLAIHFFHITLINSFFLFRKQFPNSKINLHDFRLSVISSLILPTRNSRLINNPSSKNHPSSKNQAITEHIPKQYELKDGRGRTDRKRCKLCYSKQIRKDTMYFCPFCSDSPPLCKVPCFKEYHNTKKQL